MDRYKIKKEFIKTWGGDLQECEKPDFVKALHNLLSNNLKEALKSFELYYHEEYGESIVSGAIDEFLNGDLVEKEKLIEKLKKVNMISGNVDVTVGDNLEIYTAFPKDQPIRENGTIYYTRRQMIEIVNGWIKEESITKITPGISYSDINMFESFQMYLT